MSSQPFDFTDSKYAAWATYLEEHKDDYPEDDEKVRRGKLSIDYQLSKFYDKYDDSIAPLVLNPFWKQYVSQYYHHKSLSTLYPQSRLLAIAKAYHKSLDKSFTAKLKMVDLPAEFL